jgi:hypothetical protein
MRDAVIDIEIYVYLPTLSAGIGLVHQHLVAQPGPAHGAVPAADIGVDPDGMLGAAPMGDEDGTARLSAVLHGSQHAMRYNPIQYASKSIQTSQDNPSSRFTG